MIFYSYIKLPEGNMVVSEVIGIPPVIIHFGLGFSLINHPASYWGTPILGNHHLGKTMGTCWINGDVNVGKIIDQKKMVDGTHCLNGFRREMLETNR